MLSLIICFESLDDHRFLLNLLELSIDLFLPLDTDRSRNDECIIYRNLIVAVTEAHSPLSIDHANIRSTLASWLLFLWFLKLRDSFLKVLEREGADKGRVFWDLHIDLGVLDAIRGRCLDLQDWKVSHLQIIKRFLQSSLVELYFVFIIKVIWSLIKNTIVELNQERRWKVPLINKNCLYKLFKRKWRQILYVQWVYMLWVISTNLALRIWIFISSLEWRKSLLI